MTHFRTSPDQGYRYTTDAVEGEYMGRATKHQGLNFSGTIRMTTWFEAQVVFVRAADGVEEFAWRSERVYATAAPAESLAKMEAGRRAKALKRSGVRLEWAADREQGAKRMAKREKIARMKAAQHCGPALLEFAKQAAETIRVLREKAHEWSEADRAAFLDGIEQAAQAAIAPAEDWARHASRN